MYLKQQIPDTIKNITSLKTKLFYIVEPSNWSIKWDGRYITDELNKNKRLKSKISSSRFLLKNKIIHFGSVGTFITSKGFKTVHKSNKKVLTWFHINKDDSRIKYIPKLNKSVEIVHTSCNITKEQLINHGLASDKIITVPIGIDLKLFKIYDNNSKQKIKKELNFPENKIIIGSFQKDGIGWGEGNKPKLVKGPDIFCDTVEKLAKKYDIHILLTGPARGYVKNRLEKAGISYSHYFLNDFFKIVELYNVLDLYLVTSRAEGGPKAITESMACGIPVISTKVGMAPEIIHDKKNGFLCEIDDTENIAQKAVELIENTTLKEKLTKQALLDVKKYTWETTTKMLYEKIYSKLI